jgi:hypothetical protein
MVLMKMKLTSEGQNDQLYGGKVEGVPDQLHDV